VDLHGLTVHVRESSGRGKYMELACRIYLNLDDSIAFHEA